MILRTFVPLLVRLGLHDRLNTKILTTSRGHGCKKAREPCCKVHLGRSVIACLTLVMSAGYSPFSKGGNKPRGFV